MGNKKISKEAEATAKVMLDWFKAHGYKQSDINGNKSMFEFTMNRSRNWNDMIRFFIEENRVAMYVASVGEFRMEVMFDGYIYNKVDFDSILRFIEIFGE